MRGSNPPPMRRSVRPAPGRRSPPAERAAPSRARTTVVPTATTRPPRRRTSATAPTVDGGISYRSGRGSAASSVASPVEESPGGVGEPGETDAPRAGGRTAPAGAGGPPTASPRPRVARRTGSALGRAAAVRARTRTGPVARGGRARTRTARMESRSESGAAAPRARIERRPVPGAPGRGAGRLPGASAGGEGRDSVGVLQSPAPKTTARQVPSVSSPARRSSSGSPPAVPWREAGRVAASLTTRRSPDGAARRACRCARRRACPGADRRGGAARAAPATGAAVSWAACLMRPPAAAPPAGPPPAPVGAGWTGPLSGTASRCIRVSISPGSTVRKRTPAEESSASQMRPRCSSAALETPYAPQPGVGRARRVRADQHHGPSPAEGHAPHEGPGEPEGTQEIRGQGLLEVRVGGVRQRSERDGPQRPGVVDDDLGRADQGAAGARDARRGLRRGDVGDDGVRLSAARADPLHDRPQRLAVARDQHQAGARLSERLGERGAQAAARAGDDDRRSS